jgi:hypothetical protein
MDSGFGFGFLRRSTSSIPGVARQNDKNIWIPDNGSAISGMTRRIKGQINFW